MSREYVPLSVHFFSDERVLSISFPARLLYIASLCVAKRTERDGVVTLAQVKHECPDVPRFAARAAEVLESGLWSSVDAHAISVAAYLNWNQSRANLEELRAVRAAAGRIGGRKSGVTRAFMAQMDDPMDDRGHEQVEANTKQVASTRRTQLKSIEVKETNSRERPDSEGLPPGDDGDIRKGEGAKKEAAVTPKSVEFDAIWARYPRKLNRAGALKAFIARRREGIAAEELAAAVRHYAESRRGEDPSFAMHGATFFGPNERWRDYVQGVPEDSRPTEPRPSAPPVTNLAPRLTPESFDVSTQRALL